MHFKTFELLLSGQECEMDVAHNFPFKLLKLSQFAMFGWVCSEKTLRIFIKTELYYLWSIGCNNNLLWNRQHDLPWLKVSFWCQFWYFFNVQILLMDKMIIQNPFFITSYILVQKRFDCYEAKATDNTYLTSDVSSLLTICYTPISLVLKSFLGPSGVCDLFNIYIHPDEFAHNHSLWIFYSLSYVPRPGINEHEMVLSQVNMTKHLSPVV